MSEAKVRDWAFSVFASFNDALLTCESIIQKMSNTYEGNPGGGLRFGTTTAVVKVDIGHDVVTVAGSMNVSADSSSVLFAEAKVREE